MNEYFKNKVVWVTGASSGIGEEIAKQVANAEGTVILSSRNIEKLLVIKQNLKSPDKHLIFQLDLENLDNVTARFDELWKSVGSIDYFFNNGGVSQRGEAHSTPIEVDRKIMEIDYFGNITLTKLILPFFQSQKHGHIVVMSSIAGKFGFYLRSAYSAAKHALHGFYESLRLEEAKNNLKVTLICPGKINTPISTNAIGADGEKHGVMDHNQATGMSVEDCVSRILSAVSKNKKEALIGNKEIMAVYLKRYCPAIFYRVIRKQSAV
ncbi:MAG: SDR family NAD(P)-dependent oxidoreductase [Bacteroidetes bacterium]|nr:SDR family NAD(P)-dependent oxidoreductase [Bacteroidota bacterium]